jgi:hypothetical protein
MKIKKKLLMALVLFVISFLGSFLTYTFAYDSWSGAFCGGVITVTLGVITMELIECYVD